MAHKPITEAERFWRHVDIRGADECWPWLANQQKKSGYGLFMVAKDKSRPFGLGNSTSTTAHRVAYRLTYGKDLFDNGCHSCDNPSCCNPAHIFPGTQKENISDMYAKGRQPNTDRTRRIGEQHGRCVVTDQEVMEIRDLYRTRVFSQDYLAQIYGIGQSQISRIIQGESRTVQTPDATNVSRETLIEKAAD